MTAASNESFSPAQSALCARAVHAEEDRREWHDDGLSEFMRVRPRLFGIAYRILGGAAAAEDVVQDVWLRWQMTDRAVVRDAVSFLATTTTRLSINVIQSARSRRETCVATWLPEPADTGTRPGTEIEQREALQAGFQLLLERLSPTERAAYILREAFGYAYRDIAALLRLREANARQLVTRARRRLTCGRRAPTSVSEQRGLFAAFMAAAQSGDVARLEGLFTSHVASTANGRGAARAPRHARLADRSDDAAALCGCAA